MASTAEHKAILSFSYLSLRLHYGYLEQWLPTPSAFVVRGIPTTTNVYTGTLIHMDNCRENKLWLTNGLCIGRRGILIVKIQACAWDTTLRHSDSISRGRNAQQPPLAALENITPSYEPKHINTLSTLIRATLQGPSPTTHIYQKTAFQTWVMSHSVILHPILNKLYKTKTV